MFLSAVDFLNMTDSIGDQARLLTIAQGDAVAAGTHGPVYDTVSVLDDKDVESNSLLSALENFDAALTRDRVLATVSEWNDIISGFISSLSRAGVEGGIDGFCDDEDIRVSPWFSIAHNAVRGAHLASVSVFAEDSDETAPGTDIDLATLTQLYFTDGGITFIPNTFFDVNGNARLGVGTGAFAEFDALDSTVYNAAGAVLFVEITADPTVGTMAGLDFDLVLDVTVLDEALSSSVQQITLPAGSGIGFTIDVPGGRYLQVNNVAWVSGGDIDTVLKVKARAERTIALL